MQIQVTKLHRPCMPGIGGSEPVEAWNPGDLGHPGGPSEISRWAGGGRGGTRPVP